MEEIEREVLVKLKNLTLQGKISWRFEGDGQKICVAIYRDTRLKLFTKKLDLEDHDGNVAEVDVFISESLATEFEQLVQVARKSCGQYPTCEIKAVTKNSFELYHRLLQD